MLVNVGDCRFEENFIKKLLWTEGSELENGPLTGFASDLEDSTAKIEAIIPIWRRVFGRVDMEAGRDGIRGGSRSQPCHEHYCALQFEFISVSTKDAWKSIGFVCTLFHRVPA
jgi:hypothetical protein